MKNAEIKFKSDKQSELTKFRKKMQPLIDSLGIKTNQLIRLLDMVETHRKNLLAQLTSTK